MVVGVYRLIFDVSNFNISGYNTSGTYSLTQCTSPTITAILCNLTIANNTKIIQISNYVNSTYSIFPSDFTIVFNNLLLTPLLVTNNTLYIPIQGSNNAQYLIYSSPNTVKFQLMCNLPCATCPSALLADTCLSCYIDSSISLLKYLYNSVCYTQCPTHTFYSASLLNSSMYLYTCSICSANCV